jgi:hypothetical protein
MAGHPMAHVTSCPRSTDGRVNLCMAPGPRLRLQACGEGVA